MKKKSKFSWFATYSAIHLILLFLAPGGYYAQTGSAQSLPAAKIDRNGPALKFDFPDMLVGVAEYDEGPTGTTVFYFPKGVKGVVDMRGGAPGELNAEILQNAYERRMVQAVVFSGGSWYGLSAATGVANGIKKLRAAEGNVDFIAGVVGAIIFDVGGRRFSRVTPDEALGDAALRAAASGWFPLGARGAGRFAMQGAYFNGAAGASSYANWPHSGQGGAFLNVGPTKIGVFTIVNSLGAVVDRDGRLVRCGRNEPGRKCPLIRDEIMPRELLDAKAATPAGGPTANTTITLVVTNQKLPFSALQRLAAQVHTSMSRAIQPFATQADGDILYAVTTDEVENEKISPMDLGVIASELAWDAVLASVPVVPERPAPLKLSPPAHVLLKVAGTYEFYGGGKLVVSVEADRLVARFEGNGRIYFDNDKIYPVAPAENGLYIIESPGREVIRFDENGGSVKGLTLNPGPWPIRAEIKK